MQLRCGSHESPQTDCSDALTHPNRFPPNVYVLAQLKPTTDVKNKLEPGTNMSRESSEGNTAGGEPGNQPAWTEPTFLELITKAKAQDYPAGQGTE